MSSNINQVFIANPTTTVANTSLIYLGLSPFGAADDSAVTWLSMMNSITRTGTIVSGTWNSSLISGTYGGTGVNNGLSLITVGGNLTFSGAFTFVGTLTAATSVIFPTSGTLATTAQIPTPSAMTRVDDTNVTLTLGGTPATALLQATSLTLGWTGTLGLTRGGLAASITASNGGIFYSTATSGALLSGTPTASQVLLSGTSAAPSWSTAVYPASTTINRLLYSSATNVISEITASASSVLLSSSASVPAWSGAMTNGQIIVGSTGATPVVASLTAGSGITITPGAGSITITAISTGTVNPGLINNIAYYAAAGSAISGLTSVANGTLITGAAGLPSILASPASNGSVLSSTAAGAPIWSTPLYANTYAVSTILYTSAANTVSGLATVNRAMLSTNATGVPTWLAATDGQLVIGSTAGAPVAATLTAGTNISIVNASNSITINSTAGTVNAGLINNIAYYATAGTAVSGITSVANGTLITGVAGIPSILASPASNGSVLSSTAAGAPVWSTPLYANTYPVSSLLYAGALDTVSGLATVNRASLSTNATGVPVWLALTDGQIVVGSTAGAPAASTLTAGSGISILNASNSITISASGSGISWSTIAGTSQAAAIDSAYVIGNAALTTVTLPTTAAIGSSVAVEGLGAGGWVLAAGAGQTIKIGLSTTTVAGSLASVAISDNVYVVCIVANTTWRVQTTNSNGLTIA